MHQNQDTFKVMHVKVNYINNNYNDSYLQMIPKPSIGKKIRMHLPFST